MTFTFYYYMSYMKSSHPITFYVKLNTKSLFFFKLRKLQIKSNFFKTILRKPYLIAVNNDFYKIIFDLHVTVIVFFKPSLILRCRPKTPQSRAYPLAFHSRLLPLVNLFHASLLAGLPLLPCQALSLSRPPS